MNILWLLLGGGPFFGWWCVLVDIYWLVVGGGGWRWMKVMVVGRGTWWHSLV